MLNTRSGPIDSLLIPFRAFIWLSSSTPTTSPPSFRTRAMAALSVPPVASTSSIRTTLSPACSRCRCTSITSVPYSNAQANCSHSPGSFPCLRIGQQGLPTRSDSAGPNRNPLDSSMNNLLYSTPCNRSVKASMTSEKMWGQLTMGKMSMKSTPFLGKSWQCLVAPWILAALSASIQNIFIAQRSVNQVYKIYLCQQWKAFYKSER